MSFSTGPATLDDVVKTQKKTNELLSELVGQMTAMNILVQDQRDANISTAKDIGTLSTTINNVVAQAIGQAMIMPSSPPAPPASVTPRRKPRRSPDLRSSFAPDDGDLPDFAHSYSSGLGGHGTFK